VFLGSKFDSATQKSRPGGNPRRRLERVCAVGYFAIRYVRSPAASFDDSTFSPPLLPRTLTKPQPYASATRSLGPPDREKAG
jgi:hypothetical protein